MLIMQHELLQQLIQDGYIYVQTHESGELSIYNYAPKTQYERCWNEWTLLCRGLIMDKHYNIVARPFQKFFNLEEHLQLGIPQRNMMESFEVYEKMDGSLGILYQHNNQYFIATRGSFNSEQALKATQMLYEKYAHAIPHFLPNKTYLFEIIYPENRIVIDYGNVEELVLLAVIDTQTGQDEPLPAIGIPVVKRYNGMNDLSFLKTLQEENKEGFVVKFHSGFRVKIKFEEYVRLHRILTQVSSRNIWEYLSTNQSFEQILDRVPDEFYEWVKKVVHDITIEYQEIENYCKTHFNVLESRKETALYFQTLKYQSVLFAMLDGKNYAPFIWKMVKPDYEKPFRIDEES